MRMWMTDPRLMCMQHLLGEHGEIHKHRHNFVKGHRITGRIEINAVEPLSLKARHDELETEIRRRAIEAGRKPPCSPFEQPGLDAYSDKEREYRIDKDTARELLINRCWECCEMHETGSFCKNC